MRPLAVLSLLLGAIASLFFAFAMISGDSRGGDGGTRVTPGPIVKPNLVKAQPAETETLQLAPVSAPILTPVEPQIGSRDRVLGGGAHIGFIRGSVVDPDGNPVRDAMIDLIRLADGALWSGNGLSLTGDPASATPLNKTQSDKAGKFHFGSLEPGDNWGLSVRHPDYAPQVNGPILVHEKGGKDELVQLERGNVIDGLVLNANLETPLENALLTLVNPMSAFLPSTRQSKDAETTRSNAKGEFRFKNINGAQRTLIVQAEGFGTQVLANFSSGSGGFGAWSDDSEGEPGEQQSSLRVIRMLPGMDISGVVLAPDRSGVPGVRITAVNSIGNFGSRSDTVSGQDGSFVLKDLGPGAFSITSVAKEFQTRSLQRIEAGSKGVEIQLIEFGSVSGTVSVASTGKPLAKFSCKVRNEHPSNPSWGVVANNANFRNREDGSFEIKGIKEGRYVLEVESPGFASSFSAPFKVTQGIETPDIQIGVTKGSTISGRVLDASSGQPLPGAQVKSNDNNFVDNEFMKFLGGMGSSATSKKMVITEKDGSFKLDLMTPDTYQLRVWKAGYTAIIVNDVSVRDGGEMRMPDFRLPRGATVSGIVYDEGGLAVPGANVIMSPDDPTLYADQLQVRADANGAYSFKNVREGSYKLQSTRPQRPGANPFAGAVDMQASMIQVEIGEGQSHVFEIRFDDKNRNKNKPNNPNF